jgi:hypothetical protein
MTRINNPMEIFKVLPQTNCKDCNEKTCLAFAVAVFKNRKPLDQCPHLAPGVLEKFGGETEKPNTIEEDMRDAVTHLKNKIPETDLAEAAKRTGARFDGKKLTLKVMGKDFSIYPDGTLSSDLHINPWLAVPVLNYVLNSAGTALSGKWITFRELKGGMERYSLFQQRCEKPLKTIADNYPDLFRDMLDIFSGKRVEGPVDADVAVILYPLPLLPIIVCYWTPEDGIESSLYIYFDESANDNLDPDSLYTLTAGMIIMFGKIAQKHGIKSV